MTEIEDAIEALEVLPEDRSEQGRRLHPSRDRKYGGIAAHRTAG